MLQFFLFHFNSDPQLLLSLVLCGRGSHLETASLSLSLVNMCSKYYTEYSAICHPVYGEVFGYLLGEFITIVILHNILLMLTKVYMYIQFVQGTKALQFLVNECYWPRACLLFFSFKFPSLHIHTHAHTTDGPCSIRVSRLKIADTAISSPTPAEIVKRHNK